MKKYIASLVFLLTCLILKAQSDVYYQTDFNDGIPANFTLIDKDENPIKTGDFNNITPNGSWFASRVDTQSNQAALSTSNCQYDLPNENWLITPPIQIKSGEAWLKWDAKSIHYDFREGYKVMISTTDKNPGSFTELFSTSEEKYDWNTHLIPLNSYKDQEVYIAFVCNSKNKFLLAIDNLYVGIPSAISLCVTDETERFVGDTPTALIKGRLKNTGKAILLYKIICESNENNLLTEDFNGITFLPGEEQAFEFSVPTQVGKITNYTLKVETNETTVSLLQDSIVCSYFPRTLVAEEYTGTWCNNCPEGILQMNKLKDRYKNQIITITGHCDDPMEYDVYSAGLHRWLFNLPAIIYNRDGKSIQNSMNNYEPLRKALLKPTLAKADLSAEYAVNNMTSVKTQAKITFANDYDNSNDYLKLGYAIIEKESTYDKDVKQKNSSSIPQRGEFYYLPYMIPNNLMIFHDVAKGTASAFKGVDHSVPQQIEAYKEYTFNYEIELPETILDKNNIKVIVFILNTVTDEILNASETEPLSPLSVTDHPNSDEIRLSQDKNNNCLMIEFNNSNSIYTIDLISLDGQLLHLIKGKESICRIPFDHFSKASGCYLIRITRGTQYITKKIVLY